MQVSDQVDLLDAAIGGDSVAAGRLLFAVQPKLLAYVDRNLPHELASYIDARDIVQDTFIEALRRFGTFKRQDDDSFFRWLVTIATRHMLQLLRAHRALKRGGNVARDGLAGRLLEEMAITLNTPSRAASHHELALSIQVCLSKLPAEQACALRLRHVEQLSIAAIAEQMGRTEGSIHMICNRGMKRLAELLQSMSRFR